MIFESYACQNQKLFSKGEMKIKLFNVKIEATIEKSTESKALLKHS